MSYNFEKLDCWKNAKDLAVTVYQVCKEYPSDERFSLVSQTTRAVVSIAANIAEGSSRSSKKDFSRFIEIALGSSFELETLLAIAFEQKYLSEKDKLEISSQLNTIIKQVYGLKRTLSL